MTANATSTWAPLRVAVFRWLWLASLVSNVGAWMQTVGAQWLLVHAANAAILVSLVQTADMLPDVLFAIVGGVLADILDRRRLIISVQLGLAVAGALLTAFTIAGHISPALLLMFTFIIGSGSVFITPAYQSLVPELVPREDVPSAVQLNSINVNIARAVGPGIAGIVIAHFGVGADFALNAGTFLVYALVVAFWRPPANLTPQLPERFMSALRAGGRYVRYSPIVRRILLRATLFLVPASALWGLLPLVASRRLGLGPGGYGLLLGALGVGAIAGATFMSNCARRRRPTRSSRSPVDSSASPSSWWRCSTRRSATSSSWSLPARPGSGCCDAEHVTPTVLAGVGPSPRALDLPDGALRRAGSGCCRLGCDRRRLRTHRGVRRGGRGARRGHRVTSPLAVVRHGQHGPQRRRAHRTLISRLTDTERGTRRRGDDLYGPARERRGVQARHDSRARVALPNGRDRVGPLSQR